MPITLSEIAQAFLADEANLAEHRKLSREREATLPQLQAIQNITKKWSKPIFDWKAALNYFSVAFAERFPQ